MLLELTDLLGRSYGLQEVMRDQLAAVGLLRDAFAATPELRETAKAELTRLNGIVAAREMNGQHGCHIARATQGLLAAALNPLPGTPQ